MNLSIDQDNILVVHSQVELENLKHVNKIFKFYRSEINFINDVWCYSTAVLDNYQYVVSITKR